ncbi:hypothetical protein CHU00_12970 [Sphingobacterium cellulitidis]|uniref:DUF2711 family protein n=1 Tax=Sphingobacterium cellulitidis TaxID=1768011 RepID=UPI000B942D0E|nr:DUF2711 family protein [Sphingobacterium cellulitidis]OYD42543.1 hypothetical protein CHT99_06885 [Sphingobacterium cellulitidis]OYD45155.1 hypothetical protein CHU00_12970 [Sphingobacterium cellulitidis]
MKSIRKLPDMDRSTIGPAVDIPILTFYEGIFDSVFLSLNPFLQLLDSSTLKMEEFWNEDLLDDFKKRIIENTSPISWHEILMLTGFNNIIKIDVALRTAITGLVEEKRNCVWEDILIQITDKNQMFIPSEGCFPEIQINFILKAIKRQGYDWICLGTEFGDCMELVWIDDLINDVIGIQHNRNLYTYDRKILITCHWDSFQVYICSNHATVKKIVHDARLEGFYANQKTEVYWSTRK